MVLVLVLGSGLSAGQGRSGKGKVWGDGWMDAQDKLGISESFK